MMKRSLYYLYVISIVGIIGMSSDASGRTLDVDVELAVFSNPLIIDNLYYPLVPDTIFTYLAETDDETEEVEIIVTNGIKEITLPYPDNRTIECVIVEDRAYVDGLLMEETYDWYAQDDEGNVWYMGEDTVAYERDDNGNVIETSTEGSWEAGVDGALPGIVMWADPKVGDSYQQEYYEGEAEDMGKVLRLNAKVSIEYGDFDNCLVTKEWTPLEPGVVEHKYYAPGVGQVFIEELKEKTVEVELLYKETD